MYNIKKGWNMKKTLLIILSMFLFQLCVLADDSSDIKEIFNKYVNDANNYSRSLPDYYVNNAKIVRVVNKKQGGQKTIIIPYDRYLKELGGHSALAKAVNYKNRYVNIKVSKHGDDYKLSATRIPRNDKYGLPCYFIYTKEGSSWKIKEESMTTNVQTFLSAK